MFYYKIHKDSSLELVPVPPQTLLVMHTRPDRLDGQPATYYFLKGKAKFVAVHLKLNLPRP